MNEDKATAVESWSVSWLGKQSLAKKNLSQFALWGDGFLPSTRWFVLGTRKERSQEVIFFLFEYRLQDIRVKLVQSNDNFPTTDGEVGYHFL